MNGRITFLINEDGASIKIEDYNSNITFCKVKLTQEQTLAILSRQACVDCEIITNGLENVGKKHECKTFDFEIPESMNEYDFRNSEEGAEKLQQLAQSQLEDGWISDRYFGSRNSFFSKNNKHFARITIRRYI